MILKVYKLNFRINRKSENFRLFLYLKWEQVRTPTKTPKKFYLNRGYK